MAVAAGAAKLKNEHSMARHYHDVVAADCVKDWLRNTPGNSLMQLLLQGLRVSAFRQAQLQVTAFPPHSTLLPLQLPLHLLLQLLLVVLL